MERFLVTGACGQIGSDLVRELRHRHGDDAVVATDIIPSNQTPDTSHPYETLDVLDASRLTELAGDYGVRTIYHLASLLSARGEQHPDLAWNINMNGLRNVLDLAVNTRSRVFWPSSIAVFGPRTPRIETPQYTVLDPTTVYGVTKVAGELLCRYYADRYGIDVRSVRYPGIISYTAPPGGGTTDYAVEIFYAAVQKGSYTCFVRPDTRLPMMYMPDAIRATVELMDAPAENIQVRTSYNLAAISFKAEKLAAEIARHVPGFTCAYEPDFHQAIADSWPAVINDGEARRDWGWQHHWDLAAMVKDMIQQLRERLNEPARIPAS